MSAERDDDAADHAAAPEAEAFWRRILAGPDGAAKARALLLAAPAVAGPWVLTEDERTRWVRRITRVGGPIGIYEARRCTAEILHVEHESWSWAAVWSSGRVDEGELAAKAAVDRVLVALGVVVPEPESDAVVAPPPPSSAA